MPNLKRESSTTKGRNYQPCCHSPPQQSIQPQPRVTAWSLHPVHQTSLPNQTQAMPKLRLLIYSPPEQSTTTLVGVQNVASPIHRQTGVCWFRPWVKPPGILLNRSIPSTCTGAPPREGFHSCSVQSNPTPTVHALLISAWPRCTYARADLRVSSWGGLLKLRLFFFMK